MIIEASTIGAYTLIVLILIVMIQLLFTRGTYPTPPCPPKQVYRYQTTAKVKISLRATIDKYKKPTRKRAKNKTVKYHFSIKNPFLEDIKEEVIKFYEDRGYHLLPETRDKIDYLRLTFTKLEAAGTQELYTYKKHPKLVGVTVTTEDL